MGKEIQTAAQVKRFLNCISHGIMNAFKVEEVGNNTCNKPFATICCSFVFLLISLQA